MNGFNQAAKLIAILLIPIMSNSAVGTATQSLNASLSPIGKVSVAASLPMTHAGVTFLNYSGTLPVSYRVRTTPGGNGSITLQATSDFSPGGGPAISAGILTYTCSGATLGTGCSGTLTVSTTSQTPVLTLPASACTGGGGACSGLDPNSVSLNLNLADDPGFATGSYSAQLTFTISAT